MSAYAALRAFQFVCATLSGIASFLASASTLTSSSAMAAGRIAARRDWKVALGALQGLGRFKGAPGGAGRLGHAFNTAHAA